MAELGTAYLRRIERIHPFVWKCIGLALLYDPVSLSALVLANNCLYAILCQHKRELMERGLPDDAFIKDILAQLREVNDIIDCTGHIEMPEEVAAKLRKGREQEKLRLEREAKRSENQTQPI